jgi:hypothetical protein
VAFPLPPPRERLKWWAEGWALKPVRDGKTEHENGRHPRRPARVSTRKRCGGGERYRRGPKRPGGPKVEMGAEKTRDA